MIEPKPYRLKNKIQNYAWGTKNEDAFIPRFLGELPERDVPYAELWIGAHPKAPSTIIVDDKEQPLNSVIEEYPNEILGEKVTRKFGNKLPYLLKILSCERALSIQAHPGKELAKKLHANDPGNYPDENHKPEVAIALDGLKALVGFKPIRKIVNLIEQYSALRELVPEELFLNLKESYNKTVLQQFYSLIMHLAKEDLEKVVDGIKRQINNSSRKLKEEEEFIKQYEVYGVDVGLLSILLFNMVDLKEGEAIYTEAGIPHAYLKGNIIECMANSDNVVRAGLTPKYKDVYTLIEVLNFNNKPVTILRPTNSTENVYKTNAEEFELFIYDMEEKSELDFESDQVVIGLVLEG